MSQPSKSETVKILFNTLKRVLKNRERFSSKDYYRIVKNNEFKLLLDSFATNEEGYKLYYVESRQLSLTDIPKSGRIPDNSGLTFEFKAHNQYPYILGVVSFYYD